MIKVNFDCQLQLNIDDFQLLFKVLKKIDDNNMDNMINFDIFETNFARKLVGEIRKTKIIS